jgi:plastocyanin
VRSTRLLSLALGLAAGCSLYGGGGAGGVVPGRDGPLPPNVVEIDATDALSFAPAQVTVPAGTTVRWVNRGSFGHTVTSGASSRATDSPGAAFDAEIAGGELFEHTFTAIGVQPFFCRFHEAMGMAGVVTVSAPSSALGADGGGTHGDGYNQAP